MLEGLKTTRKIYVVPFKPKPPELLDMLIAHLQKEVRREKRGTHHSHFDMDRWLALTPEVSRGEKPLTMCGTSACLAGTAVLLTMPIEKLVVEDTWNPGLLTVSDQFDFEKRGARLFGIPFAAASLLFLKSSWPDWPKRDYETSETQQALALLRLLKRGDLTLGKYRRAGYSTGDSTLGSWVYFWMYKGERIY